MDASTTAHSSTCVGYDSGGSITTFVFNTAIGLQALDACTTESFNVAVGSGALGSSTQSANTAVGHNAAHNASSAANLVCIGTDAGNSITSGGNNTFVGRNAGTSITTGSNNTILGAGANASNTTSNTVVLGNSSISALRCQVQTISSLSDERDKTNIVDSEDGLNLINLLKPRKFTWAMRETSDNDGKTELGFIAQELASALGDKNDYIHAVDKEDPDKLLASYGRLIPILVKSIQELSVKVTALEAG